MSNDIDGALSRAPVVEREEILEHSAASPTTPRTGTAASSS